MPGWRRAKPALLFAMNFLHQNGDAEDESLLSSPFFLITLAYFYEHVQGKLRPGHQKTLLEWVLVGSGRGYYSGSSETKLDADLARIRSDGDPDVLVQNLVQLFGRKRFEPAESKTDDPRSRIDNLRQAINGESVLGR